MVDINELIKKETILFFQDSTSHDECLKCLNLMGISTEKACRFSQRNFGIICVLTKLDTDMILTPEEVNDCNIYIIHEGVLHPRYTTKHGIRMICKDEFETTGKLVVVHSRQGLMYWPNLHVPRAEGDRKALERRSVLINKKTILANAFIVKNIKVTLWNDLFMSKFRIHTRNQRIKDELICLPGIGVDYHSAKTRFVASTR